MSEKFATLILLVCVFGGPLVVLHALGMLASVLAIASGWLAGMAGL
jgi:hypothetical protein